MLPTPAPPSRFVDQGRTSNSIILFCSGNMAERGAVAEDQAAGHVDLADQALAQVVDRLADRLRAAELHAVLDDAAVLLGRVDHLAALEDVVAAGLLDVHVLARLARPDG